MLPAYFVFPREPLDLSATVSSLLSAFKEAQGLSIGKQAVIVLPDQSYLWAMTDLQEGLQAQASEVKTLPSEFVVLSMITDVYERQARNLLGRQSGFQHGNIRPFYLINQHCQPMMATSDLQHVIRIRHQMPHTDMTLDQNCQLHQSTESLHSRQKQWCCPCSTLMLNCLQGVSDLQVIFAEAPTRVRWPTQQQCRNAPKAAGVSSTTEAAPQADDCQTSGAAQSKCNCICSPPSPKSTCAAAPCSSAAQASPDTTNGALGESNGKQPASGKKQEGHLFWLANVCSDECVAAPRLSTMKERTMAMQLLNPYG